MKTQIESIIINLIDATEEGNLTWTESSWNASTRDYKRRMVAQGEDGTIFHTTIEFRLAGDSWKIQDNGVFIENPDLPDGTYLISKYQTDLVVLLRNLIMSRFCPDLNPTVETVEKLLEGISKGICKSTHRGNKLKDLGI